LSRGFVVAGSLALCRPSGFPFIAALSSRWQELNPAWPRHPWTFNPDPGCPKDPETGSESANNIAIRRTKAKKPFARMELTPLLHLVNTHFFPITTFRSLSRTHNWARKNTCGMNGSTLCLPANERSIFPSKFKPTRNSETPNVRNVRANQDLEAKAWSVELRDNKVGVPFHLSAGLQFMRETGPPFSLLLEAFISFQSPHRGRDGNISILNHRKVPMLWQLPWRRTRP
jgi:hypothetical protein